MAFTTQSVNANDIEKVDAYASHVRGTAVTPAATAAAPHGVMVKTLTSIGGKEQISVSELLSKTGVTAANLKANDRLRVRFVVTMKDGRVFSWQNSGPGITVNALGTPFTPLLDILVQ
jgi:fructose-1-phosphate kinase PfkB-like protein